MERRAITIAGVVQGVGFRPFVYRVATSLGLRGFVRNQAGAVFIDVEGNGATLDRFEDEVRRSAPAISHIETLQRQSRPLLFFDRFSIDPSESNDTAQVFISPDIAVCGECLTEMFDRSDRRFGYPFLNCTNCGPRLTIIRSAPYDRRNTTMADFTMCPACRAEYENPANGRFHAQPTACPTCGPRLEVVEPNREHDDSSKSENNNPLDVFIAALLQGQIGALKGLGGYHLVCDARRQDVVSELRRRKHREEMPLAIMVRDIEDVRRICEVSPQEQELLESSQRPIVLLEKRPLKTEATGFISDAVAPGNPCLGVMLPYTPLHHLLLAKMDGIPLVMTSGNRSHEPIAYMDEDATKRLGKIADIFLRHNRPIRVRCDDSVVRVVDGLESPIRRSRGYAPMPVSMPVHCGVPMLAVGGQFKGVFALGRGRQAVLSHHLGDLDQLEAYRQFEHDIALYEELFQTSPRCLVHDLHPDYASTHYAVKRSEREQLPRLAVQHHHAHMASCMAENGLTEQVIGITFDGTGYGRDATTGEATIWGGEFLVGDFNGFHRAAHLRNVPMPGGDAAVREPWRMAAAHLLDASRDLSLLSDRIPASALNTIQIMLAKGVNAPLTSSMGRLFDAVASIIGLRDRVSYEGQAAMQCEWLAAEISSDVNHHSLAYPFGIEIHRSHADATHEPMVIDTRPLISAVADDAKRGVPAAQISRRFHATLAVLCLETCERIRYATQLNTVVLSGGVFMNAILSREVTSALTDCGFDVYRHRIVPPNDAGIAFGQLAVAAAQSAANPRSSGDAHSCGELLQAVGAEEPN